MRKCLPPRSVDSWFLFPQRGAARDVHVSLFFRELALVQARAHKHKPGTEPAPDPGLSLVLSPQEKAERDTISRLTVLDAALRTVQLASAAPGRKGKRKAVPKQLPWDEVNAKGGARKTQAADVGAKRQCVSAPEAVEREAVPRRAGLLIPKKAAVATTPVVAPVGPAAVASGPPVDFPAVDSPAPLPVMDPRRVRILWVSSSIRALPFDDA